MYVLKVFKKPIRMVVPVGFFVFWMPLFFCVDAQGGFTSLTPEQIGELPEVSCDVDSTCVEFMRRSLGKQPVKTGPQFFGRVRR